MLALLLCKQGILYMDNTLHWSSEVLRVHPKHPLSVLFEHLLNCHSRLLGVLIPQAQEFAISDSVHRGLVEVLIRGPCLEQSVPLQLCVCYTFCR